MKKIKVLKEVSIVSVTEICKEAGEKLAHWMIMNRNVLYHAGRWTKDFSMDKSISLLPESHQQWLINKKFIEIVEEFEPFDITIKIETKEDLTSLWHRTEWGTSVLSDIMKKENITSKDISGRAIENLWRELDLHYRKLNK